jgi:hypothetical protein
MWRGNGEIMREGTFGDIHEAISQGYCYFGYTLESNVPKQRPTDNGELEYQITEYYNKVKPLKVETDYEQERETAIEYKKSVTFRKIADLHRYGYRMAERFVPDNFDNCTMLTDFIKVWENFCKSNLAEDMQYYFSGVTFKIYKENDRITWKATFHSKDTYSINDVTVTEKNIGYFSLEDVWILEDVRF